MELYIKELKTWTLYTRFRLFISSSSVHAVYAAIINTGIRRCIIKGKISSLPLLAKSRSLSLIMCCLLTFPPSMCQLCTFPTYISPLCTFPTFKFQPCMFPTFTFQLCIFPKFTCHPCTFRPFICPLCTFLMSTSRCPLNTKPTMTTENRRKARPSF